ncbi:alpha/beta fold hydrolase [Idiomarina sp. UBA3162]|uniref:alpha/beta fold hydrolase n=1 Tax=Idiomarina sp. UBA3162 TaxID=1946641 RepID=UPI000C89DDC7|nr:alpha/beta fold hydrolase [Idiomarina sp. UBA3162]MAD54930.1 hypothetical protein [Idiomarinaceae bacterium]|tara:strand:- start:2092 stop:3102 length:1011 start_codon:yes stop_codon:yes gene_type:complete
MRIIIVTAFLLHLTGCTSLVADQIAHPNAMNLTFTDEQSAQEIFNLQPRKVGSLDYFYAPAAGLAQHETSFESTIKVALTNSKTGTTTTTLYHYDDSHARKLSKQSEPRGQVIMLHSYSTDSRSLYIDSRALRAQGYDVLLLDLNGHGRASDKPVSFGPADVERLHHLVTLILENSDSRLLLYGKSYGASVAAQYIAKYGNIDGFIGIAPMNDFTEAALIETKRSSPWLTQFISDEYITAGIESAVASVGANVEEANTARILDNHLKQNSWPPSLIFVGGLDKLSKKETFISFDDNSKVKVITLPDRPHIAMMVYDNTIDKQLSEWLVMFEKRKLP